MNRASRTLFIVADFPPRTGGAACYHGAIVRALGAAVIVYHPRARHWLWETWRIAWVMLRERPRRVLVGEILPYGTIAWALHAVGGPPYVVLCHGFDLLSAQRVQRKRQLAQRILHHAERIIANSAYTASLARTYGVLSDRITVVPPPMGVTPDDARSAAVPDVRAEAGLDGSRIVLTVARLVARKGMDDLIHTMAIVTRTFPRAVLVVVGDGPERPALESLAQHIRLRVRFTGAVDDRTLAAWYTACECFALLPHLGPSSDDVEGFGIVFLEAAAFGKPVVATRSGGVPEAVVDGVTGVLVPPQDPEAAAQAIIALLRDPERARELGAQGSARVAEFNADAFARHIHSALGV